MVELVDCSADGRKALWRIVRNCIIYIVKFDKNEEAMQLGLFCSCSAVQVYHGSLNESLGRCISTHTKTSC